MNLNFCFVRVFCLFVSITVWKVVCLLDDFLRGIFGGKMASSLLSREIWNGEDNRQWEMSLLLRKGFPLGQSFKFESFQCVVGIWSLGELDEVRQVEYRERKEGILGQCYIDFSGLEEMEVLVKNNSSQSKRNSRV